MLQLNCLQGRLSQFNITRMLPFVESSSLLGYCAVSWVVHNILKDHGASIFRARHFMKLHRLGPEDEGTMIPWNVRNYWLHGSTSHRPWILSMEVPVGWHTLLLKANKFPSWMPTNFGNLWIILDEYLTSTAPDMLLLTHILLFYLVFIAERNQYCCILQRFQWKNKGYEGRNPSAM